MPNIESPQNATFRKLLSLTSAKGLKKEGLFLLSGAILVEEFLKNPYLKIIHEVTTSAIPPLTSKPSGIAHLLLTPQLFAQIDVLGTHSNILVL
jgi:hypothetical protein